MNELIVGDKTKSRAQRAVPDSLCMINMVQWREAGHIRMWPETKVKVKEKK